MMMNDDNHASPIVIDDDDDAITPSSSSSSSLSMIAQQTIATNDNDDDVIDMTSDRDDKKKKKQIIDISNDDATKKRPLPSFIDTLNRAKVPRLSSSSSSASRPSSISSPSRLPKLQSVDAKVAMRSFVAPSASSSTRDNDSANAKDEEDDDDDDNDDQPMSKRTSRSSTSNKPRQQYKNDDDDADDDEYIDDDDEDEDNDEDDDDEDDQFESAAPSTSSSTSIRSRRVSNTNVAAPSSSSSKKKQSKKKTSSPSAASIRGGIAHDFGDVTEHLGRAYFALMPHIKLLMTIEQSTNDAAIYLRDDSDIDEMMRPMLNVDFKATSSSNAMFNTNRDAVIRRHSGGIVIWFITDNDHRDKWIKQMNDGTLDAHAIMSNVDERRHINVYGFIISSSTETNHAMMNIDGTSMEPTFSDTIEPVGGHRERASSVRIKTTYGNARGPVTSFATIFNTESSKFNVEWNKHRFDSPDHADAWMTRVLQASQHQLSVPMINRQLQLQLFVQSELMHNTSKSASAAQSTFDSKFDVKLIQSALLFRFDIPSHLGLPHGVDLIAAGRNIEVKMMSHNKKDMHTNDLSSQQQSDFRDGNLHCLLSFFTGDSKHSPCWLIIPQSIVVSMLDHYPGGAFSFNRILAKHPQCAHICDSRVDDNTLHNGMLAQFKAIGITSASSSASSSALVASSSAAASSSSSAASSSSSSSASSSSTSSISNGGEAYYNHPSSPPYLLQWIHMKKNEVDRNSTMSEFCSRAQKVRVEIESECKRVHEEKRGKQ